MVSVLSPLALAEGTVRLNFGVYSSNKPSAMVKVYRPILKELEVSMSQRLRRSVDIRMQIAKDYDQGISHLINGRVDFSAFGPASYVEAKRMNKGINILAVENVKNSKVFYGIIAVSKDSPITSIRELRGKSFAFGDEGSTIGRFLSQLELEQAGIHASDLVRYEYLGRHDKVGTAVGAGDFDAGALNEKTFKKLVEAGENIRELVRFPNVTKPWIARSGLDEDVLQALRESLLEVKDQKTLASLKIEGFLEGTDEDYSVIRKAMDNNPVFFAERDEPEVQPLSALTATATEPVAEPGLKAALADNTKQSDSTRAMSVETAVQTTTDVNHAPAADGHHLILNITLPHSLFRRDSVDGSHSVTINLTIPDAAVSDTAMPAVSR
ncbi:MAG: PhnD/SsuA/transferrin family substrate-binding protein [Granulosicoccus sp.]|nr:PhnD/SsuA/transferrin family substrate-binding protein [Granulosicoccus sp.]